MWRCPLCKLGIPKGLSQRMANHMRAKHRLEAHADFSREDWMSAIRGGKGKRAEALGHQEIKFHTARWMSTKSGCIREEKKLNRWCATCWSNLDQPGTRRVPCTGTPSLPPRRYWKWWTNMRQHMKKECLCFAQQFGTTLKQLDGHFVPTATALKKLADKRKLHFKELRRTRMGHVKRYKRARK